VPFHRRPSPADRLLAAAAAGERALRAVARRLAAGRAPLGREDLVRLAGGAGLGLPGEAYGDRPGGAPAVTPPPPGPPLIYLPALPWAFRVQRPQRLALALARAGAPVVYVEAFLRTRLQPRVWVTAPAPGVRVVRLAVPGRPDPFRQPLPAAAAVELAAELVAGLTRPPRAVIAQLPFWGPLARALAARFGMPLVYDRIDLHTGFPGVPPEVGAVEEELIAAADLVTATSEALAGLPRRLGVRTALLPNAADPAGIAAAPYRDAPAGGPAAGFAGALDGRIDAAAVAAAARALPGWRFRLAGRVEDPALGRLAGLPNVELLGEIPHQRVPAFLAGLDAGLVPYRDTPLTRAIDPVKLYEMLAAGLPVALRRLTSEDAGAPGDGTVGAGASALGPPLVYPYDEPEALADTLARAREEDSPALHERRREAARGESWERRAADLLALLAAPEC
jgi:glycosyltransferase involved in cell wall biosynthesis